MKAFVLCLLLLTSCANLKDSAYTATATDAATSAIGVYSGLAVEVNPLLASPAAFVAVMVARIAGTEYVDKMPEPSRTEYLSAMNSVWWGFGASNIAVLLFASNPIGAGVGLMTAAMWWVSTEGQRAFAEICAAERLSNPALVCEWK